MSNLGMYQVMTTIAKKVGGPAALLVSTLGAGYLAGRGVETVVKKTVKTVKNVNQRRGKIVKDSPLYTVTAEANCGGGLTLHPGDQFRMIERDGDAVQIEVISDEPEPYYFVSGQLLEMISEFPNE